MQIILTIAAVLAYGTWIWWFGKAMAKAKEWPDLIISLIILIISFGFAMVYIWDLNGFFPDQAFGELIMPLIEAVYGNWF